MDAVSCFRGALQEARASGRHVFVSAEDLRKLEGDRWVREEPEGCTVRSVVKGR